MHSISKTRRIISSIAGLLLFSNFSAAADSPVWMVEKNGMRLYLGATVHMLSAGDYPLPAAFDQAYARSEMVVLETDMQTMQSPAFQQTMLQSLSYSDGSNLTSVINRQTYAALEAFFAARGIPMASIIGFKPGMVATMMTMLELQRLGLAGTGVDTHYSDRSLVDQKKLGQLESLQSQIDFIANMGKGREDEMLAYSLEDVERLPSLMQTMKNAWRSGDFDGLEEIGILPLRSEFPEIYKALLVDRNNAWLPRIESMIDTPEVEFILVGALHLAGDDGLLSLLAARGYEIQPYRPN